MSPLDAPVKGDRVIVENGRFKRAGVVVGPPTPDPAAPYPEPRIKVEIIGNKIDVPITQIRLDDSDVSQDIQNLQLFLDAANAEKDALAVVVGTQCELIGTLQAQAAAKLKEDAGENPWFEKLLDLLELYMSRQTGSRRPLAIADADLRALYFHIIN